MIIPIPIPTWETITIGQGIGLKHVVCEECRHDYFYWITVEAEIENPEDFGFDREARRRSAIKAKAILQHAFETQQRAAPCPYCGRIQKSMFGQAALAQASPPRVIFGLVFGLLGIFLAIPAFCFSFPTTPESGDPIGVGLKIIAGGFFVVGLLMVAATGNNEGDAFDPNNEPVESRLRRGREVSLTLEAYAETLGIKPPVSDGQGKSTKSTSIMTNEPAPSKPEENPAHEIREGSSVQ